MKENTFYFPHDYNTRTDEKIKDLLFKHGMQGYGVFWAIVEDLYNNANALRTHYERIAKELDVHSELVRSVVEDYKLFVIDGDTFGSMSVQRRLDERDEKSQKARESARKRWNDANAKQTQSDRNAIKESKVNKSKVNEMKEKDKEEYKEGYELISSDINQYKSILNNKSPYTIESNKYKVESKEHKEEDTNKNGFDFDKVWALYPDKSGKKQAQKHFTASVKTDKDMNDINIALDNYLKSERVANGYVQNGSTWFNNWQDWVTPTQAMIGKTKTRHAGIQAWLREKEKENEGL